MAVGILEVQLLKAKGLRNNQDHFFGQIDPYVTIQYKSQERKSSVARGAGGNPVWNETVRFKVEYPGGGGDYKLILRIMDKDTFSADDLVGEAVIYVKEFVERGVENGRAHVQATKYSVVQPDQSYKGEIEVALTFTLKKEEEEDGATEEYGGWKESSYSF